MYDDLHLYTIVLFFFFFKQKTAYEMRISDWSSDVCSSDLQALGEIAAGHHTGGVTTALGIQLEIVDAQGLRDVVRHRGTAGKAHGKCGLGQQIGRASCRERVCQYV